MEIQNAQSTHLGNDFQHSPNSRKRNIPQIVRFSPISFHIVHYRSTSIHIIASYSHLSFRIIQYQSASYDIFLNIIRYHLSTRIIFHSVFVHIMPYSLSVSRTNFIPLRSLSVNVIPYHCMLFTNIVPHHSISVGIIRYF